MVLDKLEANIRNAASSGLKEAAEKTYEKLREYAGLTDHTLDQLAKTNPPHPYGKRGAPRIPHFHSPSLEDEPWGTPVHKQSGRLYDSIKVKQEGNLEYAIGADPKACIDPKSGNEYLDSVIDGTTFMVGRNFPKLTIDELEQQKVIYDIIEKALAEAVRKS